MSSTSRRAGGRGWRAFVSAVATLIACAASGDVVAAGVAFLTPAALNANARHDNGTDHEVSVATDGAGTWVAVWSSTDSLGGVAGIDEDVVVARSVDDGATWSAPVLVTLAGAMDSPASNGLPDRAPHVATNGSGTWLVAWSAWRQGIGPDILVARSTASAGGAGAKTH